MLANSLSNTSIGWCFMLSRIEIVDMNLRNVPESFRLTPRLTGSADITVGKRNIITYFI